MKKTIIFNYCERGSVDENKLVLQTNCIAINQARYIRDLTYKRIAWKEASSCIKINGNYEENWRS